MSVLAVTGSLGGLGANVVREACARGHRVLALARRPALLPPGGELVRGDALDPADVTALAQRATCLVHCVNVPFRQDWMAIVTRLLDVAIAACQRTGARLLYPGNVWVFGRGRPGRRLDEQTPFSPCSAKGRTRADNERTLRESGVRFSIVRLPEFYGPHVTTLTGPPLRNLTLGRTATWFGDPDVEVELSFMPDAARVLVDVAARDDLDGEVFHLPGHAAITPRAFFAEAIRQAGGGDFRALPSWVVRLASLVSADARHFSDILHLWDHPVLLDGTKVAKRLGAPAPTPYDEGLALTLAWLRDNPGAKMHY